ncbi:MAG: complex I subunit 4 family protein [Chloroflexota bacterium]
MTAIVLIVVLVLAGLLAWPAARLGRRWPRLLALSALGLDLVVVGGLWSQARNAPGWLDEVNLVWLPELGITFHVALDGFSLLLVALTCVVGIVAVGSAWRDIERRSGLFHALLLWTLAGIVGVFVALDLILFYFFWELMLVPAYYLYLWGHDRQLRAALKFFVFTQLSGLLMLLAIVGLYLSHGQATGVYTFDYVQLLANRPTGALATWLFLGFLVAFAVKLPLFPFHSWQPDAYATAPTAVSIILAGAMAKTAGYGLLRFAIPLFPQAAADLSPLLLLLAALSIVYGAWTAFGQTDFKRLVAYSSMAAMGFVMLGIFARQDLAWQGATMQMVAHGLSTSALFFIGGALYRRLGGTAFALMGGLWAVMPRLGALTLFFAVATLGLPGLGNFVGEFLVLLGAFRADPLAAGLAALGLVLATVYALWLVQRVFHGALAPGREAADLRPRELAVLSLLALGLLWLGLFPQSVLDLAAPALQALGGQAGVEMAGAGASAALGGGR